MIYKIFTTQTFVRSRIRFIRTKWALHKKYENQPKKFLCQLATFFVNSVKSQRTLCLTITINTERIEISQRSKAGIPSFNNFLQSPPNGSSRLRFSADSPKSAQTLR